MIAPRLPLDGPLPGPEWCTVCGRRLPHREGATIYPCTCPACDPDGWSDEWIAAWWWREMWT